MHREGFTSSSELSGTEHAGMDYMIGVWRARQQRGSHPGLWSMQNHSSNIP